MSTYFRSLLAVDHFNFDLNIEPKENYSAFKRHHPDILFMVRDCHSPIFDELGSKK